MACIIPQITWATPDLCRTSEHFICKQMDNIFCPCVKQMSDTRSRIHARSSLPRFHPSRPQQRSRVASGLWRRREILKGARYDRVAPMKTSSDCFWSLDGLPGPNPSQTFCDCRSLARLSALWQSSVGGQAGQRCEWRGQQGSRAPNCYFPS